MPQGRRPSEDDVWDFTCPKTGNCFLGSGRRDEGATKTSEELLQHSERRGRKGHPRSALIARSQAYLEPNTEAVSQQLQCTWKIQEAGPANRLI